VEVAKFYLYAGVHYLNKISRGDAVVMGDLYGAFYKGAFYKLLVRLWEWFMLSKIIHCLPLKGLYSETQRRSAERPGLNLS
jgi:hypothetical protein